MTTATPQTTPEPKFADDEGSSCRASIRPERIAIGVCTHGRAPMLRSRIDGLAAQILPYGYSAQIIVADNNAAPTNCAAVKAARCGHLPQPYRAIHGS